MKTKRRLRRTVRPRPRYSIGVAVYDRGLLYAGTIRQLGSEFTASDCAGRSFRKIFRNKTAAIIACLDAQRAEAAQ